MATGNYDDAVLLAVFNSEDDSLEELVLLSEMEHATEKREEEEKRRDKHRIQLNLEVLTTEECKSLFRFEKHDLHQLRRLLHIPEELTASNRTRCSGIEGLCILLRRLAYPNRLKDSESLFGRGVSQLSVIVNLVLSIIQMAPFTGYSANCMADNHSTLRRSRCSVAIVSTG